MAKLVYPKPGRLYKHDRNPKRKLHVKEVHPRDPLQREIRGVLHHPGNPEHLREFSTDIGQFRAHWSYVRKRKK